MASTNSTEPIHRPAPLSQAVLDSLPDCGVCLTSADGTLIAWYPGARRLLGLGAEAVIGSVRLHSLVASEHQPEEPFGPGTHATVLRRRDGSTFTAEISVGPLDGPDPGTLVAVIRDVSERDETDRVHRLNEANLATVFNTIDVAVLILDLDGTVREANRTARAIYGQHPEGQDVCRLVRGPNDPGVEDLLKRVLQRFQAVSAEQHLATHNRTVRVSVHPLLGRSQRMKNLLFMEQDVTTQRLMELEIRLQNHQLADSVQRLSESDRARRHWLNAVSHELRTPLTSIRSYSELLLAYPDTAPGERAEFLRIILAESERLSRLINNLLDLALIENGRLAWNPTRHDAVEMTASCIDSMRATATEAGVGIALKAIGDSLPIYADRDRLQQVLVNLLSNAIKFSPSGGEIAVELCDEGGILLMAVEDQGPGITLDERSSIFQFYAQGREAPPRRTRGTGLGLAISRQIIEHHQGSLHCVDPRSGRGARFEVRIPRLLEHCEKMLDSTSSRLDDVSRHDTSRHEAPPP